MTENDGTELLHALFSEAGYKVARDFPFREGSISVDLDGWDPDARVGYEYITKEAHDELQFDEPTLARFEARMEKGELWVLLVDETEAITADELTGAARSFLNEVAQKRAKEGGST